jgi:flagellar L-ring protein precursor FlgH
MTRRCWQTTLAVALAAVLPLAAQAADLALSPEFTSLVGDRKASRVGDVITVVIVESSSASNSADMSAEKSYSFGGELDLVRPPKRWGADVRAGDETDGRGRVQRSGRLAAQISARVHEVLPSGDLLVRGAQEINVNGERTRIAIEGLVRPRDITAGNIVLSTRLANARIDYDGEGYIADRARPGLFARMFNWLGLW